MPCRCRRRSRAWIEDFEQAGEAEADEDHRSGERMETGSTTLRTGAAGSGGGEKVLRYWCSASSHRQMVGLVRRGRGKEIRVWEGGGGGCSGARVRVLRERGGEIGMHENEGFSPRWANLELDPAL